MSEPQEIKKYGVKIEFKTVILSFLLSYGCPCDCALKGTCKPNIAYIAKTFKEEIAQQKIAKN